MSASTGPVLLTPGPLTTSDRVKAAMLRDWGSRDPAFTRLAGEVLERVRDLAGGRPLGNTGSLGRTRKRISSASSRCGR